jgi:GNAT superfamily N-acetyltransferase
MVDGISLARRPATEADKGFARRVHHLAYRDVVERQFGRWDETEQDAYFEDAWPKHEHQILEWNGQACGYLAVEVSATRVDLHELVLHPHYQNRTIGTGLVLEAVSLARSLGVPACLQVLRENRAAARTAGRSRALSRPRPRRCERDATTVRAPTKSVAVIGDSDRPELAG